MKKTELIIDEVINTFTHGFGLFLSIIGFIFIFFINTTDYYQKLVLLLYSFTLVLLFLASTLLHGSLAKGKFNSILEKFDYCAIYMLIAGTYTPFSLIALKNNSGHLIFGAIWFLALLGILYQIFFINRFKFFSNFTYLIMGWLILPVIVPLTKSLPFISITLLVAGGLLYTLGVPFFALDKKFKFSHGIWHLFVLGGSICHYWSIVTMLNGKFN